MGSTHRQRRTPRLATYHILALLIAFGTSGATVPAQLTEAVLEVSVNSTTGGETLVLLRDAQGHLWLEASDLARLRLNTPPVESYRARGGSYYPVLSIPGVTVEVDEAAQHVTISAPPAAFAMTRLTHPGRRRPGLLLADPGAFINYQLSDQRIAGVDAAGAFVELGAFASPGAFTNSAVARSTLRTTQTIRLDTTLTHDFPERLETLSLGDSVSDSGSWGNAVRFAGLRWGRNFGIRPDLITTPLLTGGGSAVVPSTVDVFVNNQRVSSMPVPPGPFVVDNVPAVSGAGDVRIVVRDALGREQVMTQSFYSSVSLLAAGLQQYSLNLGRIREDYALASAHYGPLVGTASYRRGLTDMLTLAGHGEFLKGDAHALGLDVAAGVGRWGIVTATLAAGGDSSGRGALSGVGVEHRQRDSSFVFNTTYASTGFRQVGDTTFTGQRYKQRTVAQASIVLGPAGSLSVAEVLETYRAQPRLSTVSLTHSLGFGPLGSVGLTLSHMSGAIDSTSVYLSWTLALSERRAVTTSLVGGSGSGAPPTELYATVLQNPPIGPGNGWRLGGTSAGNYDADWRGQYEPVALEVELARTQGISGSRLVINGAATILDGDLRAVRSVTNSFAVVDVGGIADVPVYLDNQLVAHTDQHGRAVLHNLRAYEDNRISIDPQELPLDTDIGARSVVVAPAFRSGVVARFPVERIHGATFRLVLDDGRAMPPGASVDLNGASFPVALDGKTYVTALDRALGGVAAWGQRRCEFELPALPTDDPLPDLGTVTCHGGPDGPSAP